jgi:hypothetical protein
MIGTPAYGQYQFAPADLAYKAALKRRPFATAGQEAAGP